jgi:hypothetical protein
MPDVLSVLVGVEKGFLVQHGQTFRLSANVRRKSLSRLNARHTRKMAVGNQRDPYEEEREEEEDEHKNKIRHLDKKDDNEDAKEGEERKEERPPIKEEGEEKEGEEGEEEEEETPIEDEEEEEEIQPLLEKIPESQKKCVADLLQGLTPTKRLGRGGVGEIWELCDAKNCNYVFKTNNFPTEDIEQNEAKAGKVAGDLGIGPLILRYATCPATTEGESTKYIITQKLSGPTFEDSYPYAIATIKIALDLYWTLLVKGHWAQNDFHGGNIMYDGPEHRVYLIDYGNATFQPTWTDSDISTHIFHDIVKWIPIASTIYSKKWNADRNKLRKKRIAMEVANSAFSWWRIKFPSYKPELTLDQFHTLLQENDNYRIGLAQINV